MILKHFQNTITAVAKLSVTAICETDPVDLRLRVLAASSLPRHHLHSSVTPEPNNAVKFTSNAPPNMTFPWRLFPWLALGDRLKTSLHKMFFGVFHSPTGHPKRYHNIRNIPCRTIHACVVRQQRAGMGKSPDVGRRRIIALSFVRSSLVSVTRYLGEMATVFIELSPNASPINTKDTKSHGIRVPSDLYAQSVRRR